MKDTTVWHPVGQKLPGARRTVYLTVIRDDGSRKVIKACHLPDENSHRRSEHGVPDKGKRFSGPGWYATGDQVIRGCYETGALYRVPSEALAWAEIPDVPAPYSG